MAQITDLGGRSPDVNDLDVLGFDPANASGGHDLVPDSHDGVNRPVHS